MFFCQALIVWWFFDGFDFYCFYNNTMHVYVYIYIYGYTCVQVSFLYGGDFKFLDWRFLKNFCIFFPLDFGSQWFFQWLVITLEVDRQSYPGAALAFLSRCVTRTWCLRSWYKLFKSHSGIDDLIVPYYNVMISDYLFNTLGDISLHNDTTFLNI